MAIIKLTKGRRSLDLLSGRYLVANDFVPPSVEIVPQFANGTSANKFGGGEKVGERATNREWTFGVEIKTTQSVAEVARALSDLASFLSMAGDKTEPLYLEYRDNSNVAMEPLWGQYGANLRYEIVHATVPQINEAYPILFVGQTALPACPITLTIKPYATGLKQRLASALGGVLQDTWGTTDGQSRGLMVRRAVTNKMTNPVFGNSTWNTGWTADASLTASQNTNSMYLLPDTINSAKLVSRAANQRYYQSINVASTSTHVFVALIMLPDGGTPSSSDCVLFYNVALTTTFTSKGNGLWEMRAAAAGINAATNTGVEVKSGRAIYLIGYMCNLAGAHFFPLAWGDQLGVAWTGTAHNSTSTVTAGRVRVTVAPDSFEISRGAIRACVNWYISDSLATDNYFFSCGSTSLRAWFQGSDNTIQFTDGTNTASSAAITFSAGDKNVFEFAWGTSGLVVYRNGVSIATSGTYTPPALPSYVYIGSDDSAANHIAAFITGFAIYDYAPTATEVLADYTNILPILSDGQMLETVPYLWTKDGDDVVDNAQTSSKNFFCVCDGIPGSVDAMTEIDLIISSTTTGGLILSRWDIPFYYDPGTLMFKDVGGGVDAGANDGNSSSVGPVTTTDFGIATFTAFSYFLYRLLESKELYGEVRLSDAGSNLMLKLVLVLGNTAKTIENEYRNVTSNASMRLLLTNPISLPSLFSMGIPSGITFDSNFKFQAYAKRSSGSTNVTMDYVALFPRPFINLAAVGTTTEYFINGSIALSADGAKNIQEFAQVTGDIIELAPGKVNVLLSLTGNSSVNPDPSYTITYSFLKVTPRYSLL